MTTSVVFFIGVDSDAIQTNAVVFFIGVDSDAIQTNAVVFFYAKIKAVSSMNSEKSIVGSKYFTHVLPRLEDVYKWLCKGMTDYSIADALGITPGTLIEYKKRYPEIIEVFTRARTHRNALVMNKMFQKATGEKVTLVKQKVTKDGDVIDAYEEQYIPPDVNAADLFLRNNDPEYKTAKSDGSGITLINNSINLDELKDKLQVLLGTKAEVIDVLDYEVKSEPEEDEIPSYLR